MQRRPRATRATRAGWLAGATSVVLAAGALTAAPATSAPDPGCPDAYPVADLTANQNVTGKTTIQGTTPDTFTGKIRGVLEDGIAPGVDLILADLSSTTIDRVGIWQGMSGSPVYAPDGRLIGAVSYGLSFGPSTIAGITPASEMLKLDGASPALAPARRVSLPGSLAERVAARSEVSVKQASQGLKELPLSVGLSGPSSAQMTKLSKGLSLNGTPVRAGAAAAASTSTIPIVAGGDLAASLSYGTVTAAAVGTATTVCGDDVRGFGHPFLDNGPSTLSLHGASTVLIQDDPTLTGFTVANLGAPSGSITQDRLAGIAGSTGALPPAYPVSAAATVGTTTTRGTTNVTQQDYLPDLSFAHLYTVQGKALDRTGQGSASGSFTIRGLRRNGTPFSMTRRNVWADPDDIAYAPSEEAAEDVYAIQQNPGEVVKITSVTASTHLSSHYATYVIARVEVRFRGRWVTARANRPVPLHAGTKARLRVTLRSREAATRTVTMRVRVPKHTTGRLGTLKVVGGNSGYQDSEEFFDDEDGEFFDQVPVPRPSTLPTLLKQLSSQQQNNEVRATVRFRKAPGAAGTPRTGSTTTSDVVSGYDVFPVIAIK